MKGYLWTGGQTSPAVDLTPSARLAPWESMAIEAVGNVIEFWGFKRNQGRVWALLYLRGELLTAGEIERELELSKGGVSMLLRDLERWGVVLRVRQPQDTVWRYSAETDLVRMVSRVIEEREAGLVSRVREELVEAQRIARRSRGVDPERLERLEKMATLAEHVEKALHLFLRTSRLNIGGVLSVLREDTAALRKKSR
ncbi:MAG TPA: MarR family transcriptional regulator [Myxococcaceae bacterium]|nr:MarR family transcriptional regulator [Myxococcaceae bacterium]